MQMYKVFVNENPIILIDNENFSTKFKKQIFIKDQILDLVDELFNNNLNGICLVCSDLENCWAQFQKLFKVQKAGGGKVLNSKNEVLFIYRFKKWDLPKGKLEKGETINDCAVREVIEECGIENLTIDKSLPTTYHIFKRKNKTILKITYWFLMKSNYKGKLTPQLKEGIERVEFKNEMEVNAALKNTYENIKLLF